MKNIIVVTGASSGMGREFAIQITRKIRADEIWVIARRKEQLDELKKGNQNSGAFSGTGFK